MAAIHRFHFSTGPVSLAGITSQHECFFRVGSPAAWQLVHLRWNCLS